MYLEQATDAKQPWNKGKTIGQKAPFKPKEIWVIRTRLEMDRRTRDLALFNLAIDSKLRGCDQVNLGVNDVWHPSAKAGEASVALRCSKRVRRHCWIRARGQAYDPRGVNPFLTSEGQ